jgi:hypothetical protein
MAKCRLQNSSKQTLPLSSKRHFLRHRDLVKEIIPRACDGHY